MLGSPRRRPMAGTRRGGTLSAVARDVAEDEGPACGTTPAEFGDEDGMTTPPPGTGAEGGSVPSAEGSPAEGRAPS